MKTYTTEELIELSKGVFIDDKSASAYYAHPNGNFKNEDQFNALSTKNPDEAKEYIRIENPNAKKATDKDGAANSMIKSLREDLAIEKEAAEALREGNKKLGAENASLKDAAAKMGTDLSVMNSKLIDANAAAEKANAAVEKLNGELDAAMKRAEKAEKELAKLKDK